ncbi:MAG: GSCFA domain-containing protein [Pseudomonadota bacterium]
MNSNPYRHLPASSFWKAAIAETPASDVDPVVAVPFTISPEHKIATAGSCFAQHISQALRENGFGYLVTEAPHPMLCADDARMFGYGTFTARYGNIYTARQLRQLLDRAYGRFTPVEDAWEEDGGRWIDPFRPRIQPEGYESRHEYDADRQKHFACVRRAFEELDILVFTFGLTEAWVSRTDGAVFPLCPGVAGGRFDPDLHAFHNFTVQEIVDDMRSFIGSLREINPKAKLILTVSPVPLVATAGRKHVLAATVYSKSVLRVACETLSDGLDGVAYFPSYEIITGSFSRGNYFEPDCRTVSAAGVAHVMRVFMGHFAGREGARGEQVDTFEVDGHLLEMNRVVSLDCDEQAALEKPKT